LTGKAFEKLVGIMAKLRSAEGCPWDREQTHKSLRPYLMEEAYEVLEMLDEGNEEGLMEELGDLILQPVFHAQISKENGRFDMEDVLNTINAKLIRRHPHVFGDVEINTAEEQRIHWENLKKHEGKKSVLDGVPRAAPALMRACRIQQKASTVGFDWGETGPVWDKIHEELDELKNAVKSGSAENMHEEFGDLLFALVNLARFLKINPEDSLREAVEKFIRRFQQVESAFLAQERSMKDASLEEMDTVWEQVKKNDKTRNQEPC